MIEILFICTGNTCRSPMAEGIFNAYAAKNGIPAHAFSRGLAADGSPVSENAVIAAATYGADISKHISTDLEREDIERADRVYCMGMSHLAVLRQVFPEFAEKMSPLADSDIADPFGGSLKDYRVAAFQIADAVMNIADGIAEEIAKRAPGVPDDLLNKLKQLDGFDELNGLSGGFKNPQNPNNSDDPDG